MCKVVGGSRRNYYSAVRRNEQFEPDPQHDELIERVQKIADASDFTYGVWNERWIRLVIRLENSEHKQPVFDNVLSRNFDAQKPEQAYVSDITYIWTQEGWLYLAVVIDLYSRRGVGWSMASRMSAQLVCDADIAQHFRNIFADNLYLKF